MLNQKLYSTAIILLALLCFTGCGPKADDSQSATSQAAAQDILTGGRLVFEEDFSGDSLADVWSTTSSAWELRDGAMTVRDARNEGLWLNFPLPELVRVEIDLASHSDDGDLKFEIFTDGSTHQSGYVGIFGGWKNKLNIIARLDEHGGDRIISQNGVKVERDRRYRFSVVRVDNKLQWFIDGDHFIDYNDEEPLVGPDHNFVGLNNWAAPQSIYRVAVYDLAQE